MVHHLKNIIIVSLGFLLLFTAYQGLQNLQSSLNADEGLGVASLSVVYGSLILSSLFVPKILIKKLGCKWTIAGSMCCYIPYFVGNFYPSWYTLIPTSVILGVGAAPLWAAKCTYLTVNGNNYATKAAKVGKDVVTHYFGIFFLIFQFAGVFGNLISSLVFGQSPTGGPLGSNYTLCGADDCPFKSGAVNITGGAHHRPSDTLVYILLGIYTGCGVLAIILISIFLDRLHVEADESPVWTTVLATFRQLRDKRQLLLILLTIYIGLEQGFLSGDYTKSYVTCALGIQYVGYVMICFGATDAIFSLLFGKLSQYTGRIALFTLGAVTHIACIIALLLWKPHRTQFGVFFVFPAIWGMADAVWQTQMNALYGVLFGDHKEAAFANFRLWESLGFVIAFACSDRICTYVKLYVLLAFLVLGMVGYGLVELYEHKYPTVNSTPKSEEKTVSDDAQKPLEMDIQHR